VNNNSSGFRKYACTNDQFFLCLFGISKFQTDFIVRIRIGKEIVGISNALFSIGNKMLHRVFPVRIAIIPSSGLSLAVSIQMMILWYKSRDSISRIVSHPSMSGIMISRRINPEKPSSNIFIHSYPPFAVRTVQDSSSSIACTARQMSG